MIQMYNKLHDARKKLNKNPEMETTFQMREVIGKHLEIPDDPHEAFIPFHEILDDDKKNLRFNVIFSSSNCLAR